MPPRSTPQTKPKTTKKQATRSAIADVVAREYTIHLHKRGTSDVRLDPQLNKKVWESGIKGVPFRLRVRISRKRNDQEGAKEKLYSYVQAVNVKNPKGLSTVVVEES
ncbi:MAG: 60S ribosomal protein L31 [Heterodermia speciosa]|uniref:60S ribosomal protein L31 n=1 Tax=Heterodermia speciosa TaxID=116794 RepID=A0A8H3F616_9LECA|nr:MAG: 60S ribosomal protein L31 [Heterodermia speciosa]